MKTVSLMVQNLCIPCGCRCRYCLLSWDGRPVGIPWEQGLSLGRRLIAEAKAARPDIRCTFSFGYSMEHPKLREAIRFLREIGSPEAEMLQCDGLNIRNEKACAEFSEMLAEEGVKALNFTFYGLSAYHDRFAGRTGDFDFLLRLLQAATHAGLEVTAGIPLTAENVEQTDRLVETLRNKGCEKIKLFIPHEEGRGKVLAPVRLSSDDLSRLSDEARGKLNRRIYKTEGEWVTGNCYQEETKRALIVSLRNDNYEHLQSASASALMEEIESLDDAYYAAFPSFAELASKYGDPQGKKLFRQRDLFYHYRRRFAAEYPVSVYDVTDERQSGSRRL